LEAAINAPELARDDATSSTDISRIVTVCAALAARGVSPQPDAHVRANVDGRPAAPGCRLEGQPRVILVSQSPSG